MNAAEILNKAADVIETRGHHKGDYVPFNSDPATAPVCASAAINVAAGLPPCGYPRGRRIECVEAARDARRTLRRFLRVTTDVATWNDSPNRTAEEVVAALREAAKAAEGGAP